MEWLKATRTRHSSTTTGAGSIELYPSGNLVSGLVTLYPQDENPQIKADVILIHGLTGHYVKTWTLKRQKDSVFWPRDLLPKVESRTGPIRIMTFGYAAGQHGSQVDLDIEDAAWQLINELERVRTTPELTNRPIIFIVHSLGGLVLKKALIISNNMLSLRHILWSVEGIIFLATPHRGSALANTADNILRITNVANAPVKFVKALKLKSVELSSLAEEFRQIVDQRKLPIASFYELRALNAIPCVHPIIVPKESAILHIQSERLYGAERDHRGIAKFESENDAVFLHIVDSIINFIKTGPVSSSTHVFLPWDTSPYFKGRRDVLQEMHETFFAPAAAVGNRNDTHRRVVVIYGDGGTGKTEVALKYARENEFRYSFILFAEATSTETLASDVVSIHRNLGLEQDPGRELQSVQHFLQQEEGWLFIFDNDNDFIALNHFKLPDIDHGHVIITCRGRENTVDPRISKVIQMRPLDPWDAESLLFSRAGIRTSNRPGIAEEARKLVRLMGCIPAMVENTAAYMVTFEADVDTCLSLMSSRKSRHSLLGYSSTSSRYRVSVESLFQIRLDSLRVKIPNAYLILSSLVWLDRTRSTTSFLKKATSKRLRWGKNGEPEHRDPSSSFVPEELVELINGPEFDLATKKLKSSSLIANDEVFKEGLAPKDSIVLHPSLYQFMRDLVPRGNVSEAICSAFALVMHFSSVSEAGLEKANPASKLQMVSQVQQCIRNVEEQIGNYSNLIQSLQDFYGERYPEFRDAAAEMLCEAIESYGYGDDETHRKLLRLLEYLVGDTPSVSLQARFWTKRLPIDFFKVGKQQEGCLEAERFLCRIESDGGKTNWSNRDNAEVGILRVFSVDFMPPDPSLSPRDAWLKVTEYIDSWKPLDPRNPSTLERFVVGLNIRMRGKQAKDYRQFREAYYALKLFCNEYAIRGSQEEGWAVGDLAQVIVELEDTETYSEILEDLKTNGTNFGERILLSDELKPCEYISFVLLRVIERRKYERGYHTPEAQNRVREGDIMWMEVVYAAIVLHQARHRPGQTVVAEKLLSKLGRRFEEIEAIGTWFDERLRYFLIKACLAQVSHMQKNWVKAEERWLETILYGTTNVKEWKDKDFCIALAELSLIDAQLCRGTDITTIVTQAETAVANVEKTIVYGTLGLDTFWANYVCNRVRNRIQKIAASANDEEAKLESLPIIIRDL
ncbi:hypothetical protein BGZ60DRAFT_414934 [Tricladium varicosporioides]|nr:hypothetical protein BGZ60DRAFT_414934 [Hymenoscyphus varicosporioides]